MPDDEFETRTTRVADFRNAFFDITVPAENKLYLEVLECCANGWFQLHFIERFWRNTTQHYVEWMEYYLEDGTRTPHMTGNIMEMLGGQHHLNGHFGAG